MLTIALAASLGTLAYLVFVGSSIARAISSVSGAAVVALVATGLILTTAAAVRRIRSGGAGKTGPFVAGVLVAYLASAYSVLLLASTISSLLLASLGSLDFSDARRTTPVIETLRPWALPTDSTIDAIAAGEGVLRLALGTTPMGRDGERITRAPIVPLGATPWPGELGSPLPADLFPNHRAGGTVLSPALIDSLPRSLTAAERDFLRRVAEAPHWPVLGMVARAPHVDVLGAQIVVPVRDDVDLFDLPVAASNALRWMGQANAARIAYHLQRGDRAAARLAAEELLSFGVRLADASRFEMLEYQGTTLAAMGRDQLTRTLRVLGDPAAERLAATRGTSVDRTVDQPARTIVFERGDVREARATILQAARAPSPPSMRWELLRIVAILPCTDTRTLVFGPDAETREVLAAARAELARTASDSLLVTLAEETPVRRSRRGIAPKADLLERVIGIKARVLGNARIRGCAMGFI